VSLSVAIDKLEFRTTALLPASEIGYRGMFT
jgi:hypothetical protein